MLTLDTVLRQTNSIPVTIESLPGEHYVIREVATGTEIYIQGQESREALHGDIAVSRDNKFELLSPTFEWGGTMCAWLSDEYADTLRDKAIHDSLV